MMEMRELYEELILDHNRNPRNYPKNPEGANHHAHGFNPLCGDEINVHLKVENGVVTDVGFDGAGCAISTASASLMTEAVMGKTLEQAESLFRDVHKLLTEDAEEAEAETEFDKVQVLAGVKDYPMRVKCATLAWHTMHSALADDQKTVCTE
jgi:nitrogen fixation NifU-like protein